MGTSKPGYCYRSLTFQQCNLAHSRHNYSTSPETIQSASFKLCGSSRTLKLWKHVARSMIKITSILVSLDLVKVFIRKKSLGGFSKSCRQRVIFAVLVLFFPEFAVCLSISLWLPRRSYRISCVPWPSMPRFRATRPRPSWIAAILE